VETVVSDDAREYVKAHGGVLFVRAHAHRCCHGTMTLLDTTTECPPDSGEYLSVGSDDIDVRFHGAAVDKPHALVIELRGMFRRHLVSYWDGCAFKP
jgi:hypothetical protein